MKILMSGDIVGRLGRNTVENVLPDLRKDLGVDLVVANGENAAGGFGITPDTAKQLIKSGVDVITSGNHIWDQRAIVPYLEDVKFPIMRPMNYPTSTPGKGYFLAGDVLVVNLLGRVFLGAFDCPFVAVSTLLDELSDNMPLVVLVDFHAEATAEKEAMGWHLDGRVSAVVGTHTHVPTADTRILPKGTAYVSDLGMVGPLNSIIGADPNDAMGRFLDQVPRRLSMVIDGPARFNSVLLDIDDQSGDTISISRVDRYLD